MTTAFDLLSRGYFPKELPPPFSTLDFANRTLGSIDIPPSFIKKPRRAQLCVHSLGRVGRYRRPLGICNPIGQYNLAILIEKNWGRLERLIARSRFTISTPSAGTERALMPGEYDLAESRARVRSNGRYIVTADIARFYHSIYTHAIAWAIHGKPTAKRKRGRRGERLLGNQLDRLVSDCQDGQTIGIPVGPDTSLVIAEVIASAVDQEVQKRHRLSRGIRFMDDYELVFPNRLEADHGLEALQLALADYELALNPLKTAVQPLPSNLDQPWKSPIRSAPMRVKPKEQAVDLIALFDTAFALAQQYPDKTVLAYAVGRLSDTNIAAENWQLYQHLLFQCITSEPSTAPIVLEQLVRHHFGGAIIDMTALAGIVDDQIREHGRLNHANEVAWAVWAALIFDIKLSRTASATISTIPDSVVALLALHAQSRGLVLAPLSVDAWRSNLTPEGLYGNQWLLSYEASIKGWLKSASGHDHIGADSAFSWLRSLGVSFYDEDRASSLGPAGGEHTHWFEEFEASAITRARHYGQNTDQEGADQSDDEEEQPFGDPDDFGF